MLSAAGEPIVTSRLINSKTVMGMAVMAAGLELGAGLRAFAEHWGLQDRGQVLDQTHDPRGVGAQAQSGSDLDGPRVEEIQGPKAWTVAEESADTS
jgi:hypothetical protein